MCHFVQEELVYGTYIYPIIGIVLHVVGPVGTTRFVTFFLKQVNPILTPYTQTKLGLQSRLTQIRLTESMRTQQLPRFMPVTRIHGQLSG